MPDKKVVPFKKRDTMRAAFMAMPAPKPLPDGPFTITISDQSGFLFSAEFPDGYGPLPKDAMVHGVAGEGFDQVIANILAESIRVIFGRSPH